MFSRTGGLFLLLCLTLALTENGTTQTPEAVPAKAPESKRPTTDLYGDPLPPGAIARLGTVRFRVAGGVFTLAMSADGKTLVKEGPDHSISVWDAATGKEQRRLHGHRCFLHCLALAPDGKTVASASSKYPGDDHSTRLWDVATGRQLHSWDRASHCLAFSPDGTVLAVQGPLFTIRLVKVPAGEELRSFTGHTHEVHAMTFCADGKTLVSASYDGTCRLWDVSTGQQLRRTAGPDADRVLASALSPDGKTLAVGGDRFVRLWDVTAGKLARQIGEFRDIVPHLAFTPDGKGLLCGGNRETARLWDVATGTELRRFGSIWGGGPFAFTRDGKTLAVDGYALQLYDVATAKPISPFVGHESGVAKLTFRPDGKALVSVAEDVRTWDPATGKQLSQRNRHPTGAHAISYLPDGKVQCAGRAEDDLVLWDLGTGKELRRFKGDDTRPWKAVFSPDGSLLASTNTGNTIRVWDAATARVLCCCELDRETRFDNLAFAADGRRLASTDTERVVRVWEVATAAEVCRFEGHAYAVNPVAFSPHGRTVAFGSSDKTVRLWDVVAGKEVHCLKGHSNRVYTLAFAPDGRTLASSAGDKSILLWDVNTGEERRSFHGQHDGVDCLTFSPDGKTLASGSRDTTIVVWDVANLTGRPQKLPVAPPGKPLSPRELESHWSELAGLDAVAGQRAVWALVAAPAQAVPFLRQHVSPVAAQEVRRIQQLITDLASAQFTTRDKAARELEEMEELAAPALRKTLAADPALEARRRIERLLDKLDRPAASPKRLRLVRAMQTLEQINTAEARRLLQSLAQGADGAWLTREARVSLQRLAGRAAAADAHTP